VVVRDPARVADGALEGAGVAAVMRLPDGVLHLIVGFHADQYAAEMAAQLL
jgi:PTS system glucose-specific IIC component